MNTEPLIPPPVAPSPASPAEVPVARTLRTRVKGIWNAPFIMFLIAAVLVIGVWVDTRLQAEHLSQEVARRLSDADTTSKEGRTLAKDSAESTRELQTKVGVLESRLAESQSQQLALEALYQDLSRNRDEWALSEIEQMLTIASQQLQLAGNVQSALAALQAADNRLGRADRPQFIPLRKVLNRDIEQLKAVPNVDVAGMSLKLDSLIIAIDTLPLVYDEKPAHAAAVGAEGESSWFARLGADMWREVSQLVRIQRMDKPEPALLAPNQVFFLRENLKLRLLNARLALLSRDEKLFREDIRAAHTWLALYFAPHDKNVIAQLAMLKQLSAAEVSIALPTLAGSLSAVRNFKIVRDARTGGGTAR